MALGGWKLRVGFPDWIPTDRFFKTVESSYPEVTAARVDVEVWDQGRIVVEAHGNRIADKAELINYARQIGGSVTLR